ncbi:basic salivary proline-rich protein 3-like [Pseudopipra pipra]|uniref:basic salivary proline-rich protein 3-like n=1 Tax=Pseudopipra pipra TaxID=415032 RepID=UPI00313A15EC
MAPPGPELSRGHTKDGGCLTSTATRTPAPRPQRRLAAPLPAVGTGRGARRRRARAAGSWAAAGTGAGSPPRRRARGAPPARLVPLRSPPLPSRPRSPPPPRSPPLPLPPCPGDAVGAAPPPSPPPPPPPPQEATHGARSDRDRPRGDEAYGKKDQRPRGMLFLTPRGKRRCSPGQRQEPSYLRPWLPLSLRLPWMCRTPLAGLTLWLLCPTCCVPAVSCPRPSYLSSLEWTGRALAVWPLERLK